MGFIKKHLGASIGIGVVLAVIGFLAFRPDKLVVDDAVSETLEGAVGADQPVPATTSPLSVVARTLVACGQ